MKIYTRGGDRGKTSLFGGQKVEKGDLRIEAYGNVDELNSLIGVILADLSKYTSHPERGEGSRDSSPKAQNDQYREAKQKLLRIQKELFVLGSDLATPLDVKTKVPRVNKLYIKRLEQEIDSWDKNLPKLFHFILPGGSKIGAKLHLARSVTRRVERSIAQLASQEKNNEKNLMYINRLSDWFFLLARYINKIEKIKEISWKGRG